MSDGGTFQCGNELRRKAYESVRFFSQFVYNACAMCKLHAVHWVGIETEQCPAELKIDSKFKKQIFSLTTIQFLIPFELTYFTEIMQLLTRIYFLKVFFLKKVIVNYVIIYS